MSEVEELKAQIRVQRQRLDYAVMQLGREAKFLAESNPENRRFHRAFSCVKDVRDELGKMERTSSDEPEPYDGIMWGDG